MLRSGWDGGWTRREMRKLATAGIFLVLILDLVGAATFVHWLTPDPTVTVLRGSKLATDVEFGQIFKALGRFGIGN